MWLRCDKDSRHWQRSDIRHLLETAVVLFNPPNSVSELQPLQLVHLEIVGGPVFRAAVLGVDPEYFDQSVPFQMHNGSRGFHSHLTECLQSGAIMFDTPVGLQPGQP